MAKWTIVCGFLAVVSGNIWETVEAGKNRQSGSEIPVVKSDPVGNRIAAGPENYLSRLRELAPGDELVLEPGVYEPAGPIAGLPLFDLHGTPDKPIVISGPREGEPAVFPARASHNTVRIGRTSYLVLRNVMLDGRGLPVAAVRAQDISRDVTLEELTIVNHGNNQQTVGISTFASATNWVIRNNRIIGAGTGLYLGRPDGTAPFVHGIIEGNVVVDTIGYNLQVKHQLDRPNLGDGDQQIAETIIRHNVFGKSHNSSTGGMARPNVLIGHVPTSWPGSRDRFLIYGNFFYQNHGGDCLIQAEGNFALYRNVFVNQYGDAICVRPHNGKPGEVRIAYNTILAKGSGIYVRGGDVDRMQEVLANVVFASDPIQARTAVGNLVGRTNRASDYLVRPFAPLGELDLTLRDWAKEKLGANGALPDGIPDIDQDFDGSSEGERVPGAYGTSRKVQRWALQLDRKASVRRGASPR